MFRPLRWIAVTGLCLFAPAASGSGAFASEATRSTHDEVALTALRVARSDSLLLCFLGTRGLPGARALETMESGLPSALVFTFDLLDARGKSLLSTSAQVRLEPDPWTRAVRIHTPLADGTFESLSLLRERLLELGPLPVASLARVPRGRPMSLRARVVVHPLAPAEADWAREYITRDPPRDGEEVAIPLGALFRYFFGKGAVDGWDSERVSPAFEIAELPLTTDRETTSPANPPAE